MHVVSTNQIADILITIMKVIKLNFDGPSSVIYFIKDHDLITSVFTFKNGK